MYKLQYLTSLSSNFVDLLEEEVVLCDSVDLAYDMITYYKLCQ